jgi:hypothetical protein
MQNSIAGLLRALLKPLIVAVGVFLLLEMSTRVYLFGLAGLVPAKINSVHELPQTGFTERSTQAGLPFELKSELDDYFKLVPFVTNSRGLRDREYAFQKGQNVFRVAVVGSSFALPAGVAIEDAFHSLLEEQFSAEFAPLRYEFINFCVGMYGPEEVITTLQTRALGYDPDLVIFSATTLSMPHLIDSVAAKAPPPPKERSSRSEQPIRFQKSYPILQSFFLRLLQLRAAGGHVEPGLHVGRLEDAYMSLSQRWAAGRPNVGRAAGSASVKPQRSRGATPRQRGGSVLERLARISSATGIPIVIVRLEYDASPKLPIDLEVAQTAASLGLHYLDTRDAFQGMRARDFWIYELDPHPDATAHGIFADSIASFLRSNGLLPKQKR